MINANVILGKYIDGKGRANVMLQISISRKVKRYSLFKCNPADFDKKKQRLKGNHNHENAIINETLSKVNNINLQLAQSREKADFCTFEALMQHNGKSITWEHVIQRYNIPKQGHTAINKFCKLFEGLDFGNVTHSTAIKFLDMLNSQRLRQSTVHVYIKELSTIYNKAIQRGDYSGDNPFAGIHTSSKFRERSYLTADELQRLESLEDLTPAQSRDRDIFLFQCYTGLRTCDIKNLKWSNIADGAITIYQQKTAVPVYIPLSTHAKKILDRQAHIGELIFKVHIPNVYNFNLRHIVEKANIDKHITPHCGRHTFAVQSLNRRIPIEVVSKLLGHTDLKTTQIYAKIANPLIKDYMKLWE